VPAKSGTPAPAPAAKDGTILNPSSLPIPQNRGITPHNYPMIFS
jgi:hypothetical protein